MKLRRLATHTLKKRSMGVVYSADPEKRFSGPRKFREESTFRSVKMATEIEFSFDGEKHGQEEIYSLLFFI